jgi:hypothetical protein
VLIRLAFQGVHFPHLERRTLQNRLTDHIVSHRPGGVWAVRALGLGERDFGGSLERRGKRFYLIHYQG